MNHINDMNSQTPDQECMSDSHSHSYSDSHQTDQTQTQSKKQPHVQTILNKRYEDLRTQILELESLGALGDQSPSSPSFQLSPAAEQWWERESGQIGEEFNLITQQGMISWLEVWLELKPVFRAEAGAGDTNTNTDADIDTAVDINIGTGSIENLYKISLMQRLKKEKINKPGKGKGQQQDTKKKSNPEVWGAQDRGDRDRHSDRDIAMILAYPGALVGVLSDMVMNAIRIRIRDKRRTFK